MDPPADLNTVSATADNQNMDNDSKILIAKLLKDDFVGDQNVKKIQEELKVDKTDFAKPLQQTMPEPAPQTSSEESSSYEDGSSSGSDTE